MDSILVVDKEATDAANKARAIFLAKLRKAGKVTSVNGSQVGLEDQKATSRLNNTAGVKFNITDSKFNHYIEKGFGYPTFCYDQHKGNFVMVLSKFKPKAYFNMSPKQQNNKGGVDISFKQAHMPMINSYGWYDGYEVFLNLRYAGSVNLDLDFQIEFDMLDPNNQQITVAGHRMALNIPSIQRNLQYRQATFRTTYAASAYEQYRAKVDSLTKMSVNVYLDEISNSHLSKNPGMSIDHIFSVYDGFKYNLPAEIVAHYTNLQFLPLAGHNGNCSKNKNSWQALGVLIDAYCKTTGAAPQGIGNIRYQDFYNDLVSKTATK